MQTPSSISPAPASARQGWQATLGRAVLVVITIEVGLVLLVLPWTSIWEHGFWLAVSDQSRFWLRMLQGTYGRGVVSGLGVLNLWAAASEITHFRF
ncbi:MAG TPA: hypothetical protein VFP94_04930 [Terriglobales bacterium]|nr:hypothetical protein [Terriglobales bacterium]